MPWTNIPTFTVGQVLTSSTMNSMRVNANIGHLICTSANRPVAPDTGSMIYETDTQLFHTYNGSAWVVNGPTGRIAQSLQAQSTQITVNTGTWTTIVSQAITTTRANSKILTMFAGDCNANNAGDWKRIGIFVNGALQYHVISATANAGFQEVVSVQHLYSASGIGTYTITASAQNGQGSSTFAEEGGTHKNNLILLEVW